jgi:periplasmic protein CpxP/Spy
MFKKLFWIAAVSCSLMVSGAYAKSGMCGKRLDSMIESLKLNDEQKAKVQPIMDQLKATMKSSAGQMQDLSNQLDQQVQSATMDQSAVDGLVDKKTKVIGDMMKAKFAAQGQIFAVLTPEQKTQLQGMMKSQHEKMEAKFKSCHDED